MNKKDKKRLNEAFEKMNSAKEIVDELLQAEEEKFDNLTEGLQAAQLGQDIEAAKEKLDEWSTAIQELADEMEELINE